MRRTWIVSGVLAIVLVAGYVSATGGVPDREPPAWITLGPVAHRGQWTDSPAAPENSLPAFEAASRNGFAIELDVQRCASGETIVLHDYELGPATGAPGMVADTQLTDLKELRLLGSDETIPTLAEALSVIGGRVPVFVEIKNEGEVGGLEDDVARQLLAYEGDAAVLSFNPFSLGRMAEVAPEIPRGQLSSAFREEEQLAWYEKFLLRTMLMNWMSKPDFIAYDLEELPTLGTDLQRLRGRPLLGWTAIDEPGRVAAEELVDAVICDPDALPR
jgi:glycerophosphoryl diester phosphodiesterase